MSLSQWLLSTGSTNMWTLGTAGVAVAAVTLLWWLKRGHSVKTEYYERVRRRLDLERHRRELLTKQLTAGGQLMTVQRQLIIELPLTQLIEQLQNGKTTATEALKAYQARALEVTQLYNCITEFVYTAEERAVSLDRVPASERGPLHGVPISVKDSIDLEGFDSTLGLAKYLGQPATETAPVVQTLIDLGALPFCRTNVPQTTMSFGCSNPVWGVTKNIQDPVRVPGGSSGGEGVLVAAGGSPLGLGTDLGGSVRVPALFSGCCGLKPTCGRISMVGEKFFMPKDTGVRSTIGFLAREAADVARVLRLVTTPLATADMYRLDPLVPRAYWNDELAVCGRRWRIGYLTELQACPGTPGVRRVMTKTVQALEAAGHQLVPFQLEFGLDEHDLYMRNILPDNSIILSRVLADEELDDSMKAFTMLFKLPYWQRYIFAWAIKNRYRFVPSRLTALTADIEQDLVTRAERDQYRQRTLTRWRSARLDLLILPGFACPAPPRDKVGDVIDAGMYTMVMNLLNFPAGVLTVDRETQEDQDALESYPTPCTELKWIKEGTRGALGQPLGIQVASLPWMEEQLLAGMQDIEQAINKYYK